MLVQAFSVVFLLEDGGAAVINFVFQLDCQKGLVVVYDVLSDEK